jgi:glyoxylase-like metal-dependent hydrolase (beta-lactamase superfamily II)
MSNDVILPADLRVFVRGWLSSNSVLCLSEEPALIDTGYIKHADDLVRLVASELPQGAHLARIAHTHLHSDHCGGTHALQQAHPDALTFTPAASLEQVQNWNEDGLTFKYFSQRCERFTADSALTPGQTTQLGQHTWQVYAAPGHDALAVILFDPESGILISGDALWEHSISVIFSHVNGISGFKDFLDTLSLIERLAPSIVIPGHGAPFSRAGGAIDAALERSRSRIAYYASNPAMHALYAAKVLIKYQLLDIEQMPLAAFQAWFDETTAFSQLRQLYDPKLSAQQWLRLLVTQMSEKGVISYNQTHVLNDP